MVRSERSGRAARWKIGGQITGEFVLRFAFGSLFPQLRIFNNFSASFSGSVRFVFWLFLFVFSNFSGSFFKITSFCPIPRRPRFK